MVEHHQPDAVPGTVRQAHLAGITVTALPGDNGSSAAGIARINGMGRIGRAFLTRPVG